MIQNNAYHNGCAVLMFFDDIPLSHCAPLTVFLLISSSSYWISLIENVDEYNLT